MKTITAAFQWNVADKSISFMAIDDDFNIVVRPEKHNLNEISYSYFVRSAAKIIENFYLQLEQLYITNKKPRIIIEYKIVHIVPHELSYQYAPSRFSSFVRTQFLRQNELSKETIKKLMISQQLRARLKRPPLDEFKKFLKQWGFVRPTKLNQYQYHLWILATHATKTNYKSILKRLHRSWINKRAA